MTLPVTKPVFQDPPDEYDKAFMRQVLRQLDGFFTRLNAQGDIQATSINLSQLPNETQAYALRSGDLYEKNGDVFVVKEHIATVTPVPKSTTAVGAVTTTP